MKVRSLLCLVLLLVFCSLARAAERPAAKDFSLPDLAGRQVKLADLRGKVVFLNFWASWCPPCRAEMPSMQKLNDLLKKKKFVMLAAAQDQDQKKAVSFIKSNKYTFPVLLDPRGKVARLYGVTAYPTTFLIDKKGRVRAREIGARDWSEQAVVDQIVKLIEEK